MRSRAATAGLPAFNASHALPLHDVSNVRQFCVSTPPALGSLQPRIFRGRQTARPLASLEAPPARPVAEEQRRHGVGAALIPGGPPGPRPLPVVGNALDIVVMGLSELMLSYAQRYGEFVQFSILADVLYLVSDPEGIAHVNTDNSRNYLDRWTPPGFETLLYEGQLRGLVFSQGRYWMQHRQIVGKAFRSQTFLRGFVDAVVDKATYLMDVRWEAGNRVGDAAAPTNIHQEMRLMTLDVIGDAAFGAEFGAMRAGGHEIETSLSNVLGGVMSVIKNPVPLWKVVNTPGRAAIRADMDRLQTIELGLVNARRERLVAEAAGTAVPVDNGVAARTDLLGILLKVRDSDENRAFNFTDDDLMWDVHDIIFAGHETTASALGAALFQVAGSSRVLAEIHRELDSVIPNGRTLEYQDLEKLEYIGMVINETLRMVPPTALVGRVAKNADVISGHAIPAGANVLFSPFVMGRLERLWDSPEEFRPERFTREATANRHPMIHTPFGAGPRVCLGARMAFMEATAALAVIFQRYTFERTQSVLVCDYNSTVSFKSGMDMVIRRRSQST
jgi:enediyne biosynthesis protein E7